MEAFAISTATIVVGELGDKTQLLSLILATRLRKPMPIVAGIVVATLVNHLIACLEAPVDSSFPSIPESFVEDIPRQSMYCASAEPIRSAHSLGTPRRVWADSRLTLDVFRLSALLTLPQFSDHA